MADSTSLQPIINAIPTLLGVVIGALGGYLSNRHIKKIEIANARQQEFRLEKRRLSAEFLAEANRLLIISFEKKASSPSDMSKLAMLFSNIELLFSEKAVLAGSNIFEHVLNEHGHHNSKQEKKYHELRAIFINSVKEEMA